MTVLTAPLTARRATYERKLQDFGQVPVSLVDGPHVRAVFMAGLTLSLSVSSVAHADGLDFGSILGSLQSGGLMSLVSMIPGLNMLAGLGPIMDIVNMIPGLGDMLKSIPGLGQILGFLGMGGANLGPLNDQINNLNKWLTTAQQLRKVAENIVRPNNFNDFAAGMSGILRMAGVDAKVTPAQVLKDPQAAAKIAIDALTDQQKAILKDVETASSPLEAQASKERADVLQSMKGITQSTADNVEALQKSQDLAKEAQDRVQDSLSYSDRTARAIKDAKKNEDINKLVGSATLENLRMSALNSAALTSALANSNKIQVSTAETLHQLLSEIQRDRLSKATAIANYIKQQREAQQANAERVGQYGKNLQEGIKNSMTGQSLEGVSLSNGARPHPQ